MLITLRDAGNRSTQTILTPNIHATPPSAYSSAALSFILDELRYLDVYFMDLFERDQNMIAGLL